jgi:hypothetical protein
MLMNLAPVPTSEGYFSEFRLSTMRRSIVMAGTYRIMALAEYDPVTLDGIRWME